MDDKETICLSRGFTLIELMIVVAVLAILAAIAYPNYIDSVRKSRRALARSALLDAAQRQEAYYARNAQYTSTLSDIGYSIVSSSNPPQAEIKGDSGTVYYRILLDKTTSTCKVSNCYRFTVRTYGDQTNDSVSGFRLWSTGKKEYLPKGGNWANGWPD